MKKTADISVTVMGRIADLERRRYTRFRRVFLAVTGAAVVLIILFASISVKTMADRGTFDLLQLLGEDREIIREFWMDVVIGFIADLPYTTVALAGAGIVTLITIIAVTAGKRRIMNRKRKEIEKYRTSGNTVGAVDKEVL